MADQATAATGFPATMLVKKLDKKHRLWDRYKKAWAQMEMLYEGGVAIEANAEQMLIKKPKENSDLYQSRVEDFNYENYAGSGVDWYLAALFEKPARIEPLADDDKPAPGGETNDSEVDDPRDMLTPDQSEFWDDFDENCDRSGTPFLEHIRNYFKDLLVYGVAYSLIDLPAKTDQYANYAEQKEAGALDPYLVSLNPKQVINFGFDNDGNLGWVVIYSREERAADPFVDPKTVDCWYIFNKTNFARYEHEVKADVNGTLPSDANVTGSPDANATLVDEGVHALAAQNRVPVISDRLPKGLWLMNRAYLVAKKALNLSNNLDFSLKMSALAMPVVRMDGEFSLIASEATMVKLPYKSEFSWAEPEGKSHALLASRCATLMQDVYRAFYLIAQARTVQSTPAAQSGVSKEQDMAPSKKVLNLFGDVIRACIKKLYDSVAQAREDALEWSVQGLQFPQDPPDDVLSFVQSAKGAGVPSPTFDRELNKMVVDASVPDASTTLKQKIYDEIASAPTQKEQELQDITDRGKALVAAGKQPAASGNGGGDDFGK